MQFAEYIFELYMSEEGLNKMEPLGRGAVFSDTYIGRFLRPQTLIANPMTQKEITRLEEAMNISGTSVELLEQKERIIIEVTRDWLLRTKGNWILK